MTFDYIIIGAGSAGCVLANRLSADPSTSVLLLEAGGPDRKPEIHIPAAYSKLNRTNVDWAYETEPQAHVGGRRMFLPRGKTLGGSSSTNAMAYIRGNRQDYDDWAAEGNTGWGYDDVLPYFTRSENNEQINQLDGRFHGTGGPLNVTYATRFQTPLARAFVEACVNQGIQETHDFNGAEQQGAGLFQFTIKNGRRHSTATAFLKPILNRPNLTVRTHAHTKQILLEGGRATGVEILTGRNITEKLHARKEVIVSAGSFNSPQLLLLSGIGAEETLRPHGIALKHELPGVGQNLQDHLFTAVSATTHGNIGTNHYLKPFDQFKALMQYVATGRGPMTISPLEANAFVSTELATTPGRTDLQLHFAPVYFTDAPTADPYDINTFSRLDGYCILPTLLKPQSRGYVALRSANPLEQPLIQPNFLSAEADQRLLLHGMKMAIELAESSAFATYRHQLMTPPDRLSDEGILTYLHRRLETVYHPVGTCKMGQDEMAVVDDQLRVRGVEGLRVADASIMPTVISGNTNAPAIMIGEKAADLILGKQAARPVLRSASVA